MSGKSADSPSSRLTVKIASQSGRSIDFFGRLTGAIRPDLMTVVVVVMVIYDNIADYVITSGRQLLQIGYSL